MNGLAVNIDEEALFEVLAAANFAASAGKTTVSTPALSLSLRPKRGRPSPG